MYEAVFHAAAPSDASWASDDFVVELKMAELKMTPRGADGSPSVRAPRRPPAEDLRVPLTDLVSLRATDVGMTDLAVGPSRSSAAGEGGFTDAGISNRRRFERELVAWAPDESDVAADGSGLLEDPAARAKKGAGARGGNARAWDQFAANKSMFGVDTTFDETQYTTAIDRAAVGITEQEAARIAAEIQNTASSNIHVQEERGQRATVDYDEEDRYGAVIGTGAAAGGAHQKEKEGPTTKDGAALPAKPAWGSARAPEGALAKPTVRSASPPAPKPANGGTATNAASVPKPNATNATNANASNASIPDASAKPKTTLNANAKPFTLSASAAAFVPGKKPAAAAAPVSPMLGAYPPAGVGGLLPGMGMPPAMMMWKKRLMSGKEVISL